MKKVYLVLESLSHHGIKFQIKPYGNEEEGEILITSNDVDFVTIDEGNEVMLLNRFNGGKEFIDVDDLNILFL